MTLNPITQFFYQVNFQNIFLFIGLSGEYKDNHNYISANFRGIVNCFGGSMEATVKAGLGENKMDEFC